MPCIGSAQGMFWVREYPWVTMLTCTDLCLKGSLIRRLQPQLFARCSSVDPSEEEQESLLRSQMPQSGGMLCWRPIPALRYRYIPLKSKLVWRCPLSLQNKGVSHRLESVNELVVQKFMFDCIFSSSIFSISWRISYFPLKTQVRWDQVFSSNPAVVFHHSYCISLAG